MAVTPWCTDVRRTSIVSDRRAGGGINQADADGFKALAAGSDFATLPMPSGRRRRGEILKRSTFVGHGPYKVVFELRPAVLTFAGEGV